MLLIHPVSWHIDGRFVVPEPKLLLWDIQHRRAASEFYLSAPNEVWDYWTFKFQNDGNNLIVLQPPWLVLIDVNSKAEIRRLLPRDLPEKADRTSNEACGPRTAYMDVSPTDGSVAAAFNVGKDTYLFTFGPSLETQLKTWRLPRAVQDLCWSPDGKKLAVLLNGRYDENRHRIGMGFWDTAREPDVWIVDAHSGEALLKFWTGSNQSRVAFSRDGGLIYVINDFMYSYPSHKGAVRVFSAASGQLVQVIIAGPRGVHSNFSLSPDGRLIAADASTAVPQGLHLEPIWGAKIARVVLLDAKTGKLLFERHKKTDRDVWDPLRVAFSPDSRLLFVDFPLAEGEPQEHIEVFSIDGLSSTGP